MISEKCVEPLHIQKNYDKLKKPPYGGKEVLTQTQAADVSGHLDTLLQSEAGSDGQDESFL